MVKLFTKTVIYWNISWLMQLFRTPPIYSLPCVGSIYYPDRTRPLFPLPHQDRSQKKPLKPHDLRGFPLCSNCAVKICNHLQILGSESVQKPLKCHHLQRSAVICKVPSHTWHSRGRRFDPDQLHHFSLATLLRKKNASA